MVIPATSQRSFFATAVMRLLLLSCVTSLSQVVCGFSPFNGSFSASKRTRLQLGASTDPSEGSLIKATESSSPPSLSNMMAQLESINWENLGVHLFDEVKGISSSLTLAATPLLQSDESVTAEYIIQVCDELDQLLLEQEERKSEDQKAGMPSLNLTLRKRALKFKRYELLAKLMRQDFASYVATAAFLSPSRIPRLELPNVQDVPYEKAALKAATMTDENGVLLVADCELENMKYQESVLDKILLSVFRKLVTKNTGGVTSDKDGILGLLEQGRSFMLQSNQTPEAQHKMVYDTLGGLMTPLLPPFYRIFMSGIVPKLGTEFDGKQLGPLFYAPWLTSFVTPTFFGFLVGPSRPNRRKDGQPGGLVVEKCKFLQESGCKGLCLHQCKLPAQQFFAEKLGLPLTVQPNFVLQECQWSFGETPVPVVEDPSFPKGCLSGCASRKVVNAMGSPAFVDLCN